jgi:hypothetical protein
MKTLTKEHRTLNVDKAGPVFTVSEGDGWRQLTPGGQIFISDNYFDLAGMSIDDKTLFFEGAAVQEVQNPIAVAGAAGDLIQLCDIMSAVPLSDDQVSAFATTGNIPTSGGYGFGTFEQTIYARHRVYAIDVDFAGSNYFNLLSSNQLGSLGPTASDRVYCYRLVLLGANNSATTMIVYPARYLLRAQGKEEAEYQYLMRLKRSYDLQQRPDRD